MMASHALSPQDPPPPHVIVQIQDGHKVACDGYYDLPVPVPAYIALVTDGSATAMQEASRLRFELRRQITALPGARFETTALPCGICPARRDDFDCKAIDRDTSRNVLVVVSNGASPSQHPSVVVPTKRPHVLVLHANGTPPPVVPWSSTTTNTATWRRHATEFVPQILAAAGLTDPDARVFISYRRDESSELAEQLFDALGKRHFDVFVDRFRIEVGADFQQRILQELAHKSMAVYLESTGILASKWTRYEIAVAKSARMGVLALALDGGQRIPAIDDSMRMSVSSTGKALLDAAELAQVVERIATEHSLSQLRRRQLLRQSMQRALQLAGVHTQLIVDGAIEVQPNAGSSKRYVVWLPSRPAELADFHVAATKPISTTPVRAVVAPASHLVGDERTRMRWLSDVSAVQSFDESHMLQVARAMKLESV
jgi:hypothetical protein